MDTASVLDQYVQDLSNIPNEIAHILEEIRDKDLKFYETRKRIQQRDNQIHKFIRTHGSLRPNPKEAQAYPKIRADFEKAIQLQDEKCELASTSLYLVAKHYKRLQKEIEKLENTGLLAPADEFADALATRLLLPTSRGTGTATPPHSGLTSSTGSSAHQTNNISGISYPGATSHVKRPAPTTATIATAASRKDSSLMVGSGANSRASTPGSGGGVSSGRPTKRQKITSALVTGTPTMANMGTGSGLKYETASPGVANASASTPITSTTANTVNYGKVGKHIHAVHGGKGNTASTPISQVSENPSGEPGLAGNQGDEDEIYCFCRQVSFGDMIGCDNENCKYEWFHYGCVGLKEPPQGIWYCPACTKTTKEKETKKERKKK